MNWNNFIEWHESVISKYPEEIQLEFREARIKMIAYALKRGNI